MKLDKETRDGVVVIRAEGDLTAATYVARAEGFGLMRPPPAAAASE